MRRHWEKRERLGIATAFFLVSALAPKPASAQDAWEECSTAYESAQIERRAGRLLQSRAHLMVCVRSDCPDTARRDCDQWLAEVEAGIPTVVIEARDASGRQLTNVVVHVDGERFEEGMRGVGVEIDPGVHLFRFEAPGLVPIDREVTILEGAKNQQVSVEWPAAVPPSVPAPAAVGPGSPPNEEEPGETPIAAWVIGGVGLVAMGSFAFFGVSALADESDLEETCGLTRTCSEGQLDEVHAKRAVADISLGVGVIAISVAAIWLIVDASSDSSVATGPALRPPMLDVVVGQGGQTTVQVVGSF